MKDNKILLAILWLLVMLLVMVGPEHIQAQEAAGLQQFTAGGHVLGFRPQGVYVVSSDHMLKVTFADANSVTPMADQPQSGDNQVQPLGKVTYPHLWDGISLTYQQVAGGIVGILLGDVQEPLMVVWLVLSEVRRAKPPCVRKLPRPPPDLRGKDKCRVSYLHRTGHEKKHG